MRHATILVVDDDGVHRALLTDLLEAEGCAVIAVESALAALEVLSSTRPDLLLVDVLMPGMDGFELCRRLKAQESTRLLPLVLVTGLTAAEERVRGIEAGADDFLSKPVQAPELLARVRSLVRLKRYTDQLDHAEAVLYSLARGVEAKDPALEGHCERLSQYVSALGEALGLESEAREALRRGALLHDIGKIGIPDAILAKPGPLTPEEWRVMREHPVIGERICQPLQSLREVLPIIRHHHERWNGTGYPDGLAGPAIPLTARVLQVADVFDALTTPRPYRPPLPPEKALEVLRAETARGLWDADMVEHLQRLWNSGALEAAGPRAPTRGAGARAASLPPGEPRTPGTSGPSTPGPGGGIALPPGSGRATPVILIVEDDLVVAQLFRDALTDAGYAVLHAAYGEAALAILANPACRVDLVLLDLMLPDVDGLQLLGTLRAVADTRLPIIITTARGTPADRAAAIKGEADDFLVKPVVPEELVTRVRLAMSRRSLAKERVELAALCRMAQAVNSSLHLNAVLDRGLDHSLTALGADAGAIRVCEEGQGRLVLKRHRGLPEDLVPRLAQTILEPEGLGLPSPMVVDLNAPLPSACPGMHEELRIFREAGFGRATLIPLEGKTGLAGMLSICSRRQPTITEQDMAFLAAVGDQISTAMENARLHAEATSRALTDPLTGLPNRRHFLERLRQEVARARRTSRPLAVLLLDVDDFKRVNDSWGHAVGDEVLRQVGAVLRAPLRESDFIARYGGEEFAALLPETPRDMALQAAERLRQAVEAEPFASGSPDASTHVTISIGVAAVPEDGSVPEAVLECADRALYAAKAGGRNCVRTAAGNSAVLAEPH